MPLEHSTVLRWAQPSPGPPGEPGTLWTAHRLGSTLQTQTGSKAGLLCPLRPPIAVMATCCRSTGRLLTAAFCPTKAWRGSSMRILKPASKSQLPPCSRSGMTPSPKAALATGGRAATWPLWGQSVRFSAQASTGGYMNSGKDFTSLTHGSFTHEPGISVPTSSSHGSFDV